jgi:hypothetical protein
MRREGCDEDNLQMSDVMCDACAKEWTHELPMVEGHQGSCICGRCLTVAYADLVNNKGGEAPEGYKCTLCLELREDPGWVSPMFDDKCFCRRCVKQCSGVLNKDKETDWSRPAAD